MDWGLGHASRCIPVIKAFIEAGCHVVVASSGPGSELIKREPGMEKVDIFPFPGFSVSYSRYWLFGKLLIQIPSIIHHIERERRSLSTLTRTIRPDLIVSDNRYGLVHETIPSVMITHQLNPVLPFLMKPLESPLSEIIRRWVSRFNECWIPDLPGAPAAGRLAGGWDRMSCYRFTGWLSRFQEESPQMPVKGDQKEGRMVRSRKVEVGDRSGFRYRVLFILSGPEPQRTMLEKKIISQSRTFGIKALLVRGLPSAPYKMESAGKLDIISFLDSTNLKKAICSSGLVVCRSGYSSVMDLLVLGKKAVLVPTPGQTEQEYLADRLDRKGWFATVNQKDFNIETFVAPDTFSEKTPSGLLKYEGDNLLKDCVKKALKKYCP